jgi:hypothetical protein
VLWWGLLAFAVAALVVLSGVFYWAFTGPHMDRDIAKEGFQTEQDWRAVRRSGKL